MKDKDKMDITNNGYQRGNERKRKKNKKRKR